MKTLPAFFLAATLLAALNSYAQATNELQKKYTVVNRVINAGTEAGSIHLSDAEGEGMAWISNEKFTTGTIEVDIKGKDKLQASFVGVAFHGINDTTFECIYFRPF